MAVSRQTVMDLESDDLAKRVEAAFTILENFPAGHPELKKEFVERIRMGKEKPILKASHEPWIGDIENAGDYVDRAVSIQDPDLREKVLRSLASAPNHKNSDARISEAYVRDFLTSDTDFFEISRYLEHPNTLSALQKYYDLVLSLGDYKKRATAFYGLIRYGDGEVSDKATTDVIGTKDPVLKIRTLNRMVRFGSGIIRNKQKIENALVEELRKNAHLVLAQELDQNEEYELHKFIAERVPKYADMFREIQDRQDRYDTPLTKKLTRAFNL